MIDLQMKNSDSLAATGIEVKVNQFLADPKLPVMWVNANLKKLGFFCDISKTDEADHGLIRSVAPQNHKTGAQGVLHFVEKHPLRPGGEGIRALNGKDLFEIFRQHLPDLPLSLHIIIQHE